MALLPCWGGPRHITVCRADKRRFDMLNEGGPSAARLAGWEDPSQPAFGCPKSKAAIKAGSNTVTALANLQHFVPAPVLDGGKKELRANVALDQPPSVHQRYNHPPNSTDTIGLIEIEQCCAATGYPSVPPLQPTVSTDVSGLAGRNKKRGRQ
jgi:hypothetical protein